MRVGRSAECIEIASQLIVDYPKLAKPREIRAWCDLMENRGAAAAQDARDALRLGAPWTVESFAREKAAYRLIVGYFGLRQTASRETADAWLREWRAPLSRSTWPDAFVAYLLGDVDYDTMNKVAASLLKDDRGNALGEAAVFTTQAAHFERGSDAASRSKGTAVFRQEYSAGITLGYTLSQTLTVPGRLIKRREELETTASSAR
jgi:hypothetical protein